MSRLDSFIRRLEAQRACIDRAFELAAPLSGPVIEVGLGGETDSTNILNASTQN